MRYGKQVLIQRVFEMLQRVYRNMQVVSFGNMLMIVRIRVFMSMLMNWRTTRDGETNIG